MNYSPIATCPALQETVPRFNDVPGSFGTTSSNLHVPSRNSTSARWVPTPRSSNQNCPSAPRGLFSLESSLSSPNAGTVGCPFRSTRTIPLTLVTRWTSNGTRAPPRAVAAGNAIVVHQVRPVRALVLDLPEAARGLIAVERGAELVAPALAERQGLLHARARRARTAAGRAADVARGAAAEAVHQRKK